MVLVEMIYRITDNFPKKEQYRLIDQLCRAVISVPSNIAEGSKRHTTKEYMRFVGISQGSLAEVETQIIIAKRLGYIDEATYLSIMDVSNEIGRLLGGLFNALEKKLDTYTPTLTPTLTPV